MIARVHVGAFVLSLAAVACSSEDTPSATPGPTTGPGGSGGGGAGGAGGAGGSEIVYGACPDGYLSECATIQVPLDHFAEPGSGAPDGETIDFHFSRYPAAVQPAKRQVWLLAGGPGQAGYTWGPRVETYAELMPDADILVADHRGTGYSHRLTCPQQDVPGSYGGYLLQPAAAEACLDSLRESGDYERLAYFTSAQAAADVLAAAEAARTSDEEKIFVLGASYGTHWAHRMVQLAPDALDGVVFDGFLTPEHFAFLHYDRAAQEAGEGFAAACDLDASCTAHIGPGGALAKVEAVLDQLDATPCGPFDKQQARTLISLLLDPWRGRALIFPAVHRLERCTGDDVDALVFMANTYYGLLIEAYDVPYVNSGVLQNNIVMSELWALPGEETPSEAELTSAAEAQAFLAGDSLPASLLPMRAVWPLPPADYTELAVPVHTSAKLLWLGAELDAHAYPSQAREVPSIYPDATYIELAGASHTPGGQSPLASDYTHPCGRDILVAFIEGDGEVDTSCEAEMAPILLESPDAKFAMKWWNTEDEWGDGAKAKSAHASRPAVGLVSFTPVPLWMK
jgi:pimeloyl-ACP methyl ester carboxylesterase